jgi:glucuronoarabinoxylan endo-1,4-beta-xylanase
LKKVVGVLSFLLLLCLPAASQTQQTIRVNAGGSAYRDSKGQTWSADYGFNTGSLSHSALSAPITGSTDPTLFKSARVGVTVAPELQYQFPLVNGLYKVNLYFAETYYNKAGSRVFDVQMQGATVFSGLDIFAQAGLDHPLVKSAQVSVTQGQIVIRFVHRANANVPVISAIEILPSGSAPPPAPTAPSVTTQPKSQTVSVGQAATFSVVAAGTAPLTFQWLKNGSSISGATGTSYTTPAATAAESGSTYQVAINNSAGHLTSAAATLTVSSHPTVTVNWSDVHQQIDGFGASSASTGDGITNAQADLFWSTTAGVGLSLLRVQIENNGTYPDLATMQKAQDRGVRIWGTPWSPPGSMKSNGSTNNGGSLLAADYQAYANYLSSYVLGLKNSYGINLYALSIQNEPDYTATWQSCIWTGQQFHDFLRNNLLPTFSKNGVTAKIIMPEESGWKFDLATTTLDDSVTAAGVSIIAGHNYDGASAAPYLLGQNQGKHLWETEVSSFEAFDASMTNGLRWAQKINDWMTIANANAWHYWWLIDGNSDNEALLGPSGQTTKRLYVMGNYSKFVRPGYYRIGTSAIPVGGVSVSAYKDASTGKFAIVTINHNGSAVTLDFALSGFSANTVVPWVTSASLDLVQQPSITVGGSVFGATLPAASVTTFAGP